MKIVPFSHFARGALAFCGSATEEDLDILIKGSVSLQRIAHLPEIENVEINEVRIRVAHPVGGWVDLPKALRTDRIMRALEGLVRDELEKDAHVWRGQQRAGHT